MSVDMRSLGRGSLGGEHVGSADTFCNVSDVLLEGQMIRRDPGREWISKGNRGGKGSARLDVCEYEPEELETRSSEGDCLVDTKAPGRRTSNIRGDDKQPE